MFHLQTVASANVLMLLGCVVGVGFMVRFLVALTLDGKRLSRAHGPSGRADTTPRMRLGTAGRLRIPLPSWRLEWFESPPLSPGIPAAGLGRQRRASCMRRRPAKPVEKLAPQPSAVIARAEAAYESENTRHARHYFRCNHNCFLSDFHRVCEVLRSHSLR